MDTMSSKIEKPGARQNATPDIPMREFARSLPMALLKAREAVMSRFRPLLRDHDVTEQQWRVLRALVEEDKLEVTALAQRSFILMPSLSRILQNLEARKLIIRRPVKHDQRRALISVTDGGRALVAAIAPKSEGHYAEIERVIGPEKLEVLYGLLADLTNALGTDED